MGSSLARLGLVLSMILALAGVIGGTASAAPAPSSGYNNWSCKPSPEHPRPVVLVAGLGSNPETGLIAISAQLVKAGYCVYAETLGTGIYGPTVGGVVPMADSAAQLGRFVERVRGATGSSKVDMAGHSQGTTVPAYYMKFLGGDRTVKKFVGFGANYHGTTLYGLSKLGRALNVPPVLTAAGCAACAEYLPGSEFLRKLDDGPVAVPGPEYTTMISRYDEVVIPYTSGALKAPNAKTVVLQDRCPQDVVGHGAQAADPNVAAVILHTLDPERTPLRPCVPFTVPL